MRVYELAKQLGIDNRDLIPELKAMGYAVKSHSSALEEDIVQKVIDRFAAHAKAGTLPRLPGPAEHSRRDEGADLDPVAGKSTSGSVGGRPISLTAKEFAEDTFTPPTDKTQEDMQ